MGRRRRRRPSSPISASTAISWISSSISIRSRRDASWAAIIYRSKPPPRCSHGVPTLSFFWPGISPTRSSDSSARTARRGGGSSSRSRCSGLSERRRRRSHEYANLLSELRLRRRPAFLRSRRRPGPQLAGPEDESRGVRLPPWKLADFLLRALRVHLQRRVRRETPRLFARL